MKKGFLLLCCLGVFLFRMEGEELKIGFVNVKKCIEKSKHGSDEKTAFESMKNQMNQSLEKSEKELTELAKKLEDQDYLDSLSPAAEEELKTKFESLSQEFARFQSQYYQLLQQANYRMMQILHDAISKASEEVRGKQKLTLVLNQDSTFAYAPSLDVTEEVIKEMNLVYEKEKGTPSEGKKAA